MVRGRNSGLLLGLLLGLLSACSSPSPKKGTFDWQGHRGARGQAPENTVSAMIRALKDSVRTLEMDLQITADSTVVVAHDAYVNPLICLDSNGQALNDEKRLIFAHDYEALQAYDCGSLTHPDFPGQENAPAVIPDFFSVVLKSDEQAILMDRPLPHFNVEIKSSSEGVGRLHPDRATYLDLVMAEAERLQIKKRITIQSFDGEVLRLVRQRYPDIEVSLLVGPSERGSEKLQALGFIPDIYSPHHSHLRAGKVKELQGMGMRVIPWTVNDIAEAKKMIDYGVNGLITDYPGRLIPALAPAAGR